MAGIEVVGGDLWQWDLGRTVSFGGAEAGDEAEFARAGDCRALRVERSALGTWPVPNALLQAPGRVLCWVVRDGAVVAACALTVRGRAKPADYVYTETEAATFESLTREVSDAVDEMRRRADSGEFDGPVGPAGPQGPRGPQGPGGEKGERGDADFAFLHVEGGDLMATYSDDIEEYEFRLNGAELEVTLNG